MVRSSCQFQSRQQAGWFISIHIRWKRDFKLSQTKAPYLTNKQITTIMITENLREYSLKILTFEISLGLDKKQEQWIFPYNVAILFFQPPLPLPCLPPPSPQWKKAYGVTKNYWSWWQQIYYYYLFLTILSILGFCNHWQLY